MTAENMYVSGIGYGFLCPG